MQKGDLTYQIIGCAMKVHTELGPGLREKPYENALAIEFRNQRLNFTQQPAYPIFYQEQIVGDCQPDFMVEDKIIVECKSISSLGEYDIAQTLNYLRVTRRKVGLVLNFRNPSLERKRVQL